MFSTKRRREAAWFVIGSLAVALVLLALYAILTTRQLVGVMRQTQKGSVTTLHVVRDCTTPGQPCYERGQKQTAGAVADINKITVYAAACADRPGDQTVTQIQSCVIRKLAADDRRTP
jgi:hypothetical protein